MAHYYDSDFPNTDTKSLNLRPYVATAPTLPGHKHWEQQVRVQIPRSAMIPRRSGRTHSLTEKAAQAESQRAQVLTKKRPKAKIAERTCKRPLIINRLLTAPEYAVRLENSFNTSCSS